LIQSKRTSIHLTERPSFLLGKPGAGKARLTQIAVQNLINKSAVIIDTDSLRNAHPMEPALAENDVYSLDNDAFRWGDMLIKDCIKEGKNVVFDGTFGGGHG
jgi:tRNA A37 threonylcarbamoyladenosine biosynthesis protein TsaE